MRIRGRCERRFGFESWAANEFILGGEGGNCDGRMKKPRESEQRQTMFECGQYERGSGNILRTRRILHEPLAEVSAKTGNCFLEVRVLWAREFFESVPNCEYDPRFV